MAATIYTIPINTAFEQEEKCPFCALRDRLEAEVIQYITGPAMMEPDIRMETNRLGFCRHHFTGLRGEKNRLSLALLLESHLAQLEKSLTGETGRRGLFGGRGSFDPAGAAGDAAASCYVCSRLDTLEGRVADNTLHLWKTDTGFRAKFAARRDYCLPHAARLLAAGDALGGRYPEFAGELTAVLTGQIRALNASVTDFAASFDYRNAGKPLTEGARTSIERAIALLTGQWQ